MRFRSLVLIWILAIVIVALLFMFGSNAGNEVQMQIVQEFPNGQVLVYVQYKPTTENDNIAYKTLLGYVTENNCAIVSVQYHKYWDKARLYAIVNCGGE